MYRYRPPPVSYTLSDDKAYRHHLSDRDGGNPLNGCLVCLNVWQVQPVCKEPLASEDYLTAGPRVAATTDTRFSKTGTILANAVSVSTMEIQGQDNRKPFVLLGSGFSKAIYSGMPTLAELTKMVLDRLGLDSEVLRPFADDLEQWLSFLSTSQPWLSDIENLENQALFLRASSAVKKAIEQCEADALCSPYPTWLNRLIVSWCADDATVVTFNYDLFVERLVTDLRLTSSWADVYRMPLEDRSANFRSGGMFSAASPPGPLLRLLKLHGSTNWGYAGPNSGTHDSIYLMNSEKVWSASSPSRPLLPRHEGLYDDLQPMIVPPTGTKNLYYGSAGLRAQWKKAAEVLKSASSVTIIGYSFPPTDLAARHFFARNVPEVPITVVDRDESVAATISKLSARGVQVQSFCGDDAVEQFVDRQCGDVLHWDAEIEEGSIVPWLEVNGKRRTVPSADIRDWDAAYIRAGSLALEELPTLDLNAAEFCEDDEKSHWAELRMAYKRRML